MIEGAGEAQGRQPLPGQRQESGLRGWFCALIGLYPLDNLCTQPASRTWPKDWFQQKPQLGTEASLHLSGPQPSPPVEVGLSQASRAFIWGQEAKLSFHPLLYHPFHPSPIILLLTWGPEWGVSGFKDYGFDFRGEKHTQKKLKQNNCLIH